MKKQLFVFLMMALYAPQVFADGSVSRILPSSISTNTTNSQSATPRGGNATDASRGNPAAATRAATRVLDTADNSASAPSIVRSGARAINVKDIKNSTPSDDESRAARTSGATSAVRSRAGGAQTTTSARDNLTVATETVGRNQRVSAGSINNNPIVRRAGVTLRPTTAEVGGRATIGDTNIQTGSNIASEVRSLQNRAATTTTRETIAEAKERLEQTADLNKSCQEQYNDCMDQFCAVIDANQKRCSCSANLAKYTKVEDAVKDANNQLNDVAQRIRYVGLSADEIRAILSATEAEEALSGQTDTTETRNMLEKIESMIKDPKSTTAATADNSIGLDMNLDFSSDTADLFNLDFLNTGTTSFSNLRGTELYNAAKKRCNTVLNQCKSAGGTPQQITGNYDLAIDKDCIAYEQGLTKMNDTLKNNVRSANLMLQKARLAVLQNKNQYDAKGCIAALDTCMKDDMVCGDDYTKCLDPTKRYIDENGNVVLGRNIADILTFMTDYNNAITDETLKTKLPTSIDIDTCKTGGDNGGDGMCNVKYLMQKIGTGDKATDNGLCRPVLDKCQYYTYDSKGKYNPYNDVVINYIQRAMVNIRAAQYQIIADYASSCMTDIASCYNQQVTQVNTWSSNASVSSIYKVMSGACYNVALTCAYAVFQHDTDSCPTGASSTDKNKCIQNISEMFYQSLLCPDNSTFVTGNNNKPSGNYCVASSTKPCYVNAQCKCNIGYETFGNQCLIACPKGQERDTYGTCVTVSSN
ncbi:MAG: hypothetical protein K2M34_02075 [Alphaproteobacteria bacterium]|nr:hypothetical protein [Alphaproteobacteria bacterium]